MLQPFLITHNLYGYINDKIPCPPPYLHAAAATATDPNLEPRANPNHPIWISNDAHVYMLIISTISEASFRHVQGTKSQELWISLERVYAPHSSSREYTLKTQLLRIEMKGDETVDAYLNRAKEYSDALAAIGSPVSDKDLVMLTVSALREEYNSFKLTIAGRKLPTRFIELHALLNDHDYMIRKTWVSTTQTVQAFNMITNAVSTPSASALSSLTLAPGTTLEAHIHAGDVKLHVETTIVTAMIVIVNSTGLPIKTWSMETFSPIVKSTTIRAVLSIAISQKWPFRQLDVQNAFLHGNLNETVYMRQPPGVEDVDAINDIVTKLGNTFAIKDLVRLSYFLGIEIVPAGNDVILSQKNYILDLLQKLGLSDSKLTSSPMAPTPPLSLADSPTFSDSTKYRQVVAELQYATLSRSDITFAVNKGDLPYISDRTWSLGHPENNALSHALPQNPNTKLLQTLLPNSHGFKLSLVN
ncbi:hypothetical protein OSB04_001848 [Centaurea solstitialis]|uniref:Reverse transcriptase Ty1/copia-type domain-containing protein n=1 Tax=Centaurea solstitialis TaxID=347529 RepID=A0AA38WM54_9ASTR|nr:hypothetical protein OSB04_001848 [Centaurea solstitialis]